MTRLSLADIGRSARRERGLLAFLLVAALLVIAPDRLIAPGYQMDVAREAFYVAALTATWSLLAGIAGQFSFATVALAAIAAYTGAIWGRDMVALSPDLTNIWICVALGALAAWAVGTVLGVIVLRLRGTYLALFTLAFGVVVQIVLTAEVDLTGGKLSMASNPIPGDDAALYYLVLAAFGVTLVAVYGVIRSRLGLFLRAMREDTDAAAAMGINVTGFKILVFSLTSLLVGVVASIYFHTVPRLSPDIADQLGMGLILIYATVGGLESPIAGAIAAIGLTVLLEVMRSFTVGSLVFEPGLWRYAFFGLLFIVALRAAPDGFIAPLLKWLSPKLTSAMSPTPAGSAPLAGVLKATEAKGAIEAEPRGVRERVPDLRLENVEMRFGGLTAVDGVSFDIAAPQICGLIGPNGAGKTTLVNIIAGYHRPTGGAVLVRGERIDGMLPYEVAARGIARTFQITRSFRRLTVLENLLVPEFALRPGERPAEAERRANEALDYLGLSRHANDDARSLSGGQQKLLELARVLMLDADVLLLDEPFAGVHPRMKLSIVRLVRRLREEGRAVVLVEHDLGTVFSVCDRLIVLDRGRVIADDLPDAIRRDPRVIAAYLGTHAGQRNEPPEPVAVPVVGWDPEDA
jgi:branched-chain amino acid transport system permease protein